MFTQIQKLNFTKCVRIQLLFSNPIQSTIRIEQIYHNSNLYFNFNNFRMFSNRNSPIQFNSIQNIVQMILDQTSIQFHCFETVLSFFLFLLTSVFLILIFQFVFCFFDSFQNRFQIFIKFLKYYFSRLFVFNKYFLKNNLIKFQYLFSQFKTFFNRSKTDNLHKYTYK